MINGITGVRYKRGCQPSDLWVKYFTSSKYVKKFRKDHGEPDVVEVRQTFNDSLQAREWEEKVINRLNAVNSDRWLNKGNNGRTFCFFEHTEEVREKISKAARKRVEEGTHNFLGPENNRKKIENGTHNFLGSETQKKRIENGTHNFLGENNPVHKRIENGTHHFLGGEIQRKRIDNGTHHFLSKNRVTALNIETRRSP